MGDVSLLTIDTDGTYHDLDVLKIVGEGASALGLSLDSSAVLEAAGSPVVTRHRALLRWDDLAPECQRCPVVQQCGGGSVPHRAAEDGFRHPTIYCREMLALILHARDRLGSRIEEERRAYLEPPTADGRAFAVDLEAYERPETSEPVLRELVRHQGEGARRRFDIALNYVGERDPSQREAIGRLRVTAPAKIDYLVVCPSVVAWANVICQVARGNSVSDIGGNPISPDFGYISFLADWADEEDKPRPLIHRPDPWLRLPFGAKIIFEDEAVARAGASIVQEALAIIEAWRPDLLAEIRSISSEFQFIRDPEAHPAKIVSFSDNAVPGALYVSVRQEQGYVDPYDLADSIIHEHRHQKLYLLQDAACLLEADKPFVRSPWRSDLRPPSGLLHAVFVFTHLLEFWAHWEANGSAKLRDRARQNTSTTRKNLAEALPTLKATALTEIGSRLVSVLEERVASPAHRGAPTS
jgi:uncharacterized protein